MMRVANEGGLADLFDVMPPAVLREAFLVIVSTRPLNLMEEAERSARLSGASVRGLSGRVLLTNATQGYLASLFQFAEAATQNLLEYRLSSAIQERISSQEHRRRGPSPDDEAGPEMARSDPAQKDARP
jgi:hypothetical protein